MTVSPCFVNCGEPACKVLGCVRVYNAEHRDDGDRDDASWLPRSEDQPVLGRCPHGVDLDRDFCPEGCRV